MTRPTLISCACCGQQAPAREAREAIISWPRSECGKGTMTDPQSLVRTGVHICGECGRRRPPLVAMPVIIDLFRAAASKLASLWRSEGQDVLFEEREGVNA